MPVSTLLVGGIGKQQYAKLSYRETLPPPHVRPLHKMTHSKNGLLNAECKTPNPQPPSSDHPTCSNTKSSSHLSSIPLLHKNFDPKHRGRHLKSRRQVKKKNPIFRFFTFVVPLLRIPRRGCINELICSIRDVLSCSNSGNLLDSKQPGHL